MVLRFFSDCLLNITNIIFFIFLLFLYIAVRHRNDSNCDVSNRPHRWRVRSSVTSITFDGLPYYTYIVMFFSFIPSPIFPETMNSCWKQQKHRNHVKMNVHSMKIVVGGWVSVLLCNNALWPHFLPIASLLIFFCCLCNENPYFYKYRICRINLLLWFNGQQQMEKGIFIKKKKTYAFYH